MGSVTHCPLCIYQPTYCGGLTAEFTELPVSAGGLPTDNLWDELRTAIINRQEALDEIYGTTLDPASNPTDISVGDLWQHIIEYRAAIDAMAGYFYTSGTSRTAYTSNTLHNAAFGDNSWDPAGAPYLTLPCLSHKNLWNNMKACLDLMKWVRLYVNPDGGGVPFFSWTYAANAHYLHNGIFDPNWNTARADGFAGLIPAAPVTATPIGRWGQAKYTSTTPFNYRALMKAGTEVSKTFATPGDLTAVSTPPTLTNGYAIVQQITGSHHKLTSRYYHWYQDSRLLNCLHLIV